MIYKFVFIPFVKLDLQKTKEYYYAISPKLINIFLTIKKYKYISLNPNADEIMYNQIKMHKLNQLPYHIHYIVDYEKKQNVILAVEFSKRNSLYLTTIK